MECARKKTFGSDDSQQDAECHVYLWKSIVKTSEQKAILDHKEPGGHIHHMTEWTEENLMDSSDISGIVICQQW